MVEEDRNEVPEFVNRQVKRWNCDVETKGCHEAKQGSS